jgi:hypothetical protein
MKHDLDMLKQKAGGKHEPGGAREEETAGEGRDK